MLATPYIKCDYDKVYEPAEDSFLLLDSLEKEQQFLNERFHSHLSVVCELGPGSGIITTFMLQHGIPSKNKSIYFALDINPWALEATHATAKLNACQDKFLDTVQSDLTSSLRNKEIDVLVFNPPYVPADNVPMVPS